MYAEFYTSLTFSKWDLQKGNSPIHVKEFKVPSYWHVLHTETNTVCKKKFVFPHCHVMHAHSFVFLIVSVGISSLFLKLKRREFQILD